MTTAVHNALRVRVLGALNVDGVSERDLGSRKARTTLKVLALARGRGVSAERIADILWGDQPPARPADQVGVLVSRLRRVLGAERLTRTDAGYALACDWLDVDELAARVDEAHAALADRRLAAARAAAEAAVMLARGPVLPEEDGEWVEGDRAAAAACTASALRVLADTAYLSGDYAAAAVAAERALVQDPYDEAALRVLMRAHVAARRPASALAAYVRVRERLVDDLGVSPTAETEALHDEIVLADGTPPDGTRPGGTRPDGPSPPVALAGRDRELERLDEALAAASGGEATVVVIEGEPGIGKSTLLATWTAGASGRALVLTGRCDALGRELPLQPVIDAVAANLAVRPADERPALLGADAGVLGPLVGVDAADSSQVTVVTDAEIGQTRLFTAMLAVVERLAASHLVVLALDDLHLAGPSTLAWLAFAVRRLPRLLVVATRRPVEADAFPDAARIVLGPIDLAAAVTVVGPERAAELHARSGGHPLFLTALAHSEGDELPSSVREAVERRVGDLGAGEATVRTAAVLGGEVDLDLLADVLRTPAVELLEHLEAAMVAGVLVERAAGFAFRNELERDALELSVGAPRRALVHREAARALAARPGDDPLVVAFHARLGGETALAVDAYVRAAQVATDRHDLDAAAAHLDAALALDESVPALVARARTHMAAHRLEQAAEDAARAIAAGGGALALEVAGWVAYYERRYAEARAYADEGVERASDPGLRVSCLALGGRVRHGEGDLADAAARLESALAEQAPPGVRNLATVWLAQVRVHQGRPGDALALLERALVDPDRIAHPFAALHGRFTRVLALGNLGRVREALQACDDLDASVVRSGDPGLRMVGPAANCRAWLLRWSGDLDAADELNAAAMATADPKGPRAEAWFAAALDLADGRVLAGDFDGAAATLDGIAHIDTWQGTMAWHQRHRFGVLRARLALAAGDLDAARERALSVATDAAARTAGRYEAIALAVAALAGDRMALDRAAGVVDRLGACARIDGWELAARLAATPPGASRRDAVDAWAQALATESPDPDRTAGFVNATLGSR